MDKLKKEMEQIAGEWNGDESGYQEEQAGTAIEILEKIAEIEELLKYLNGEETPREPEIHPIFKDTLEALENLKIR